MWRDWGRNPRSALWPTLHAYSNGTKRRHCSATPVPAELSCCKSGSEWEEDGWKELNERWRGPHQSLHPQVAWPQLEPCSLLKAQFWASPLGRLAPTLGQGHELALAPGKLQRLPNLRPHYNNCSLNHKLTHLFTQDAAYSMALQIQGAILPQHQGRSTS